MERCFIGIVVMAVVSRAGKKLFKLEFGRATAPPNSVVVSMAGSTSWGVVSKDVAAAADATPGRIRAGNVEHVVTSARIRLLLLLTVPVASSAS